MGQKPSTASPTPVKALWCGPARFGSADLKEGCFCEDGYGYTIKKSDPALTTPHNEWFCSSLGQACGIPGLLFGIVEHTDKNLWFGSQYKVGEIKDWWIQAANGTIAMDSLASDISKIFVFDLFIYNVDRHLKNYFMHKEGSTYKIYALDYSRAWLQWGFPPSPLPMPNHENTMKWHRSLVKDFGFVFDAPSATAVPMN